jgi:histidine ammonia-lyase
VVPVSLVLRTRFDITLEGLRRVAWEGEAVEIAPDAVALMDSRHESFLALVESIKAADPSALIYGVTTGPGDRGMTLLTGERPRGLWTAASFGGRLPERVVRAIVLARLANLIEGHAGARSQVALEVAAMLDGEALPAVPADGNGGAGEVLALGHVFYDLAARLELEPRELMALINGSPCAAALVADVALAGQRRQQLAEQVLALSAFAVKAPAAAYSEHLEALWGDMHDSAALRSLRSMLGGSEDAGDDGHQAPVSFRILPRVLGQARRALAEAEQAAAVSLSSVTDNPVYVPPGPDLPLGTVFSTGGYHNSRATVAIDQLAFAWADVCQLLQRHTDKLFQHPATAAALSDEWTVKPLHMVQAGWAEQARELAQPSILALGAFGQNDVPAMTFGAWHKATAIGRCLDAALAVVAALVTEALRADGREEPAALSGLAAEVRLALPRLDGSQPAGAGLEALAAAFARRVFEGRVSGSADWPA